MFQPTLRSPHFYVFAGDIGYGECDGVHSYRGCYDNIYKAQLWVEGHKINGIPAFNWAHITIIVETGLEKVVKGYSKRNVDGVVEWTWIRPGNDGVS